MIFQAQKHYNDAYMQRKQKKKLFGDKTSSTILFSKDLGLPSPDVNTSVNFDPLNDIGFASITVQKVIQHLQSGNNSKYCN